MAFLEDLLVSLAGTSGTAFADMIPEDVADNIDSVANGIKNNKPQMNEFLTALVNKVGATRVNGLSFVNPFNFLREEDMMYGANLEDIYIEPLPSYVYDMNKDQFETNPPSPKAIYSVIDDRQTYQVTIYDHFVKLAVNNEAKLRELISTITTQMVVRREMNDFARFKHLLNSEIYSEKVIICGTDDKAMGNLVKGVKLLLNTMKFPSSAFNKQEVINTMLPENAIFVTTGANLALIDTDVLAGLFNVDKANIDAKIVAIDEFEDDNVLGVIIDKRGVIWRKSYEVDEPVRNAGAMYTNYFKNVGQLIGYSTFFNAVKFVAEEEVTEPETPENP